MVNKKKRGDQTRCERERTRLMYKSSIGNLPDERSPWRFQTHSQTDCWADRQTATPGAIADRIFHFSRSTYLPVLPERKAKFRTRVGERYVLCRYHVHTW